MSKYTNDRSELSCSSYARFFIRLFYSKLLVSVLLKYIVHLYNKHTVESRVLLCLAVIHHRES